MKLPTAIRILLKDMRLAMPELYDPGHSLTAGMTDSGKSCLMFAHIIECFRKGIPCWYTDPKGETIDKVWAWFGFDPEGRKYYEQNKHRILPVDLCAPCDYVVPFNALSPVSDFANLKVDSIALTSDMTTTQIRKQSGFGEGDAMRMQALLRASIGVLIDGGHGRYTMRELTKLFVPFYEGKEMRIYNPFLEALLKETTHDGTLEYWRDRWPGIARRFGQEWVEPVYNRISQYYFDERVALTTCSVKHARLDFNKVINDGYWVFLNIPIGALSEEKAALVGNFCIMQLFYAAMRRGERWQKPYYLFLDEAALFNSAPLDMIMKLTRYSGLFLHLIVQHTKQLRRTANGRVDEGLREEVLALVRYWSILCDTEDADELADLMLPVTGQLQIEKPDGRVDLANVILEQKQNAQKFRLQKRQVVLWDKMSGERPMLWPKTPDVPLPKVSKEQVEMFKAEHLMKMGVPAQFVRDEIKDRLSKVDEMFQEARLSVRPTPKTAERVSRPSDLGRPQ
jgi:hypothetical protein